MKKYIENQATPDASGWKFIPLWHYSLPLASYWGAKGNKEAFPNTAKDIVDYLKDNPVGENNRYSFVKPISYGFNFKRAPDQTVTELFGHGIDAKWANILYVGQIPEKDIRALDRKTALLKKVKNEIKKAGQIQFKNEMFTIKKLR